MSTLKNASLLTVGQFATYGCSFARNMILARMLSKADYGLVSVFAMTITLFELSSRMSFGTQIIQSPHGDRHAYQQTAHWIMALMGGASGALIAAMAYPAALAFGLPSITWAFILLGMVPLLKGFEHLDNHRQRREFRFAPGVLCELLPQIIVTIATWPLALWLNDFRAILWVIVSKAALTTLLTHLFAERKYRLSLKKGYTGSMLSFSWPLLLNGILIFFAQQGEQLAIGSLISLEELATYSIAFTLANTPWFMFARIQRSMLLPALSKCQDQPEKFAATSKKSLQIGSLVAISLYTPLILIGDKLIVFIFGSKFADLQWVFAFSATAASFRFLRSITATIAISTADTKNQLYTNLIRIVTFPVALFLAYKNSSIETIAAFIVFPEIISLAFSIFRLSRQGKIDPIETIPPVASIVFTISACLFTLALISKTEFFMQTITAVGTTTILYSISLFTLSDARNAVKEQLTSLRSKLAFAYRMSS